MSFQRYFATLSYHGADFAGWQVQPGQNTVQGVLNEAFYRILGASGGVVGAGRTDTGVHGRNYVAHVDVPEAPVDLEQALFKINRMLPPSVVVHALRPVNNAAHARFSCAGRSYQYRIARTKNPFNRDVAWLVERPLSQTNLLWAAQQLVGEHDFSAFAKADADHTTPLCTVHEAYWEFQDEEWHFRIRANRFLRNMVRALVGTQVELALGRSSQLEFSELLKGGSRSDAGVSAPAHGLFFNGAEYPITCYSNGSSER